jgi:hypothetical protein
MTAIKLENNSEIIWVMSLLRPSRGGRIKSPLFCTDLFDEKGLKPAPRVRRGRLFDITELVLFSRFNPLNGLL